MPRRLKLPNADATLDHASQHQSTEFIQDKEAHLKWDNWIPSAKMSGIIKHATPPDEQERYLLQKVKSENYKKRKNSLKPANLKMKHMTNLEHQLIRDGLDKKPFSPKMVDYEAKLAKQMEHYRSNFNIIGQHQTGYVPGRKIKNMRGYVKPGSENESSSSKSSTSTAKPRAPPKERVRSVRRTTYYTENNIAIRKSEDGTRMVMDPQILEEDSKDGDSKSQEEEDKPRTRVDAQEEKEMELESYDCPVDSFEEYLTAS